MATKIDRFPITPRRAPRSYPWKEWTDGGTWRLVRGEDFDLELEVFRNKLYAQASRRGLKVRTHKGRAGATDAGQAEADDDREVLFVQFYGHAAS